MHNSDEIKMIPWQAQQMLPLPPGRSSRPDATSPLTALVANLWSTPSASAGTCPLWGFLHQVRRLDSASSYHESETGLWGRSEGRSSWSGDSAVRGLGFRWVLWRRDQSKRWPNDRPADPHHDCYPARGGWWWERLCFQLWWWSAGSQWIPFRPGIVPTGRCPSYYHGIS